MDHVVLKTSPDGFPIAVVLDGHEWLVDAEPFRWYERVNWWESQRRMPRGSGRVDVEVLQVQVRPGRSAGSELVTMELVRAGRGGSWRVREAPSAAAA